MFSNATCQICDTTLVNIEPFFHARMRKIDGKPAPSLVKYRGWCNSCEIYLQKTVHGKNVGDWITSHITMDQLDAEVSEEEFQKLTAYFEENNHEDDEFVAKKKRWTAFISMKKKEDQLYRYIQTHEDMQVNGFVIKRNTFLIGFYVHKIVAS